jgi:signal transduction histidine kinase
MRLSPTRSPVLDEIQQTFTRPLKPSRAGLIAIYLFIAAQLTLTFVRGVPPELRAWYLGLMLVYILMFVAVMWQTSLTEVVLQSYFVAQSVVILALLSLNPERDIITGLFVPLSYQAALFFAGGTLWFWVGVFSFLTTGSLMFSLGALRGLSLGLLPMAGMIAFPAYVLVREEIESARIRSQFLLSELQETNQQLQAYAGQVEELVAIEERNQLARKLHDTVSQQIFSIALTTRSAQLLLKKDPDQVPELLEHLQEMTSQALHQLRSLITQLRPRQPDL